MRRRYLSTAISLDPTVNRLAVTVGDFAALLFTWMIPHADDDGSISADAEELLFTVFPGRRDQSAEDVERVLNAICDAGLMSRDGDRLRFKESFFKYQSYITAKRRRTAHNSTEQQEAAQDSAKQRTSAQNALSLKSSSSLKLKKSLARKKTRATTFPLDFVLNEEMTAYAVQHGIAAVPEFEKFQEHHRAKGSTFKDWRAAWRTWILHAVEFQRRNGVGSGGSLDAAVEKAFGNEN